MSCAISSIHGFAEPSDVSLRSQRNTRSHSAPIGKLKGRSAPSVESSRHSDRSRLRGERPGARLLVKRAGLRTAYCLLPFGDRRMERLLRSLRLVGILIVGTACGSGIAMPLAESDQASTPAAPVAQQTEAPQPAPAPRAASAPRS